MRDKTLWTRTCLRQMTRKPVARAPDHALGLAPGEEVGINYCEHSGYCAEYYSQSFFLLGNDMNGRKIISLSP